MTTFTIYPFRLWWWWWWLLMPFSTIIVQMPPFSSRFHWLPRWTTTPRCHAATPIFKFSFSFDDAERCFIYLIILRWLLNQMNTPLPLLRYWFTPTRLRHYFSRPHRAPSPSPGRLLPEPARQRQRHAATLFTRPSRSCFHHHHHWTTPPPTPRRFRRRRLPCPPAIIRHFIYLFSSCAPPALPLSSRSSSSPEFISRTYHHHYHHRLIDYHALTPFIYATPLFE